MFSKNNFIRALLVLILIVARSRCRSNTILPGDNGDSEVTLPTHRGDEDVDEAFGKY